MLVFGSFDSKQGQTEGALARSTGERCPNWSLGKAVFTARFLLTLISSCPRGLVHSQALLAKQDLPLPESSLSKRRSAGFGREHRGDAVRKSGKGDGASTTVPSPFFSVLASFICLLDCLFTSLGEHYEVHQQVIST